MFFFRSNGFALRAGALVARDWFFLSVKWLCAPRGPEAELVFSLSWFSRWWRGAGFFFWSNGFALRAGAPAAWGRFFLSVKWLALRAGQR